MKADKLLFKVWIPKKQMMMHPKTLQTIYESTFTGNGFTIGEMKEWEWLQSINRKDKNGNEIFSGDIIAVYPRDVAFYGKVAYFQILVTADPEETSWGIETNWKSLKGYECPTHIVDDLDCNYEIVGNIYENADIEKLANNHGE